MQDNIISMKRDKNGQNSCTGNSRHINTRYSFVKDRVDKKEIESFHCTTEVMLADYFTKNFKGGYFICLEELLWGGNISAHCKKYMSHQRRSWRVYWQNKIFKKVVCGITNNSNGILAIRLQWKIKIEWRKEWSIFMGVSHYFRFILTIYQVK